MKPFQFSNSGLVGPGNANVGDIEIRASPIVSETIRNPGPAAVEQTVKNSLGGIVRGVRPSVIRVERETNR